MSGDGIPSFSTGDGPEPLVARLGILVAATHRTWASPRERRRMRTFGFIPAQEPGILKRDWRGLRVRVSPEALRVILPGEGELTHRPLTGGMLLDGAPFRPTPEGVRIAEGFADLVGSYERWVEAREGREGRLSRAANVGDRRPLNALAETRRIQRLLTQTARGGTSGG